MLPSVDEIYKLNFATSILIKIVVISLPHFKYKICQSAFLCLRKYTHNKGFWTLSCITHTISKIIKKKNQLYFTVRM